jgi:flagellar protein FlaG
MVATMSNETLKVDGRAQAIGSALTAPEKAPAREPSHAREAQKKAQPEAVQPASEQRVQRAAERIEAYLKSVSRALEFRVDADSGRTVVSVRDAETGDLIRQIPGDEVLRLAEMAEDQTVVLVDEQV